MSPVASTKGRPGFIVETSCSLGCPNWSASTKVCHWLYLMMRMRIMMMRMAVAPTGVPQQNQQKVVIDFAWWWECISWWWRWRLFRIKGWLEKCAICDEDGGCPDWSTSTKGCHWVCLMMRMRIMMMTIEVVTNFTWPIASTKGRPGFIVETPFSLGCPS